MAISPEQRTSAGSFLGLLWPPPLFRVTEADLAAGSPAGLVKLPVTFGKLIWNTAALPLQDRVGALLATSFILVLAYGLHGKVQALDLVWDAWAPMAADPEARAALVGWIPWDHEWASFLIGFLLLFVAPLFIITRVFKQSVAEYGLCLPARDRLWFTLITSAVLLVAGGALFAWASNDREMLEEYPLFRGGFDSGLDFAVYELGYLLFFVAIEFMFRGYLLLGLYRARDDDVESGIKGVPGPFIFGPYAVLISMLSYTAWHLGKPQAEAFGTIVWGIIAAAVVLGSRSVIPIILVHWLLNVVLDYAIVY